MVVEGLLAHKSALDMVAAQTQPSDHVKSGRSCSEIAAGDVMALDCGLSSSGLFSQGWDSKCREWDAHLGIVLAQCISVFIWWPEGACLSFLLAQLGASSAPHFQPSACIPFPGPVSNKLPGTGMFPNYDMWAEPIRQISREI